MIFSLLFVELSALFFFVYIFHSFIAAGYFFISKAFYYYYSNQQHISVHIWYTHSKPKKSILFGFDAATAAVAVWLVGTKQQQKT